MQIYLHPDNLIGKEYLHSIYINPDLIQLITTNPSENSTLFTLKNITFRPFRVDVDFLNNQICIKTVIFEPIRTCTMKFFWLLCICLVLEECAAKSFFSRPSIRRSGRNAKISRQAYAPENARPRAPQPSAAAPRLASAPVNARPRAPQPSAAAPRFATAPRRPQSWGPRPLIQSRLPHRPAVHPPMHGRPNRRHLGWRPIRRDFSCRRPARRQRNMARRGQDKTEMPRAPRPARRQGPLTREIQERQRRREDNTRQEHKGPEQKEGGAASHLDRITTIGSAALPVLLEAALRDDHRGMQMDAINQQNAGSPLPSE